MVSQSSVTYEGKLAPEKNNFSQLEIQSLFKGFSITQILPNNICHCVMLVYYHR